ncbi:hypothetical protein BT93_B2749 [Corymbia citriodora subsp. variegata]|nr:hypothetical protein BT93_B2749 [Corymbia citriodora subsp. variegata]KAF8040622.1 hypothetical protein BT93_B2749 [Corymbia citriodora subsp. variegata]
MAIRFKFRSAPNFDSVDVGDGRPSFSVGDLKSRIRRLKNLNICSGSDLLVSDAVTGEEYRDDNVQIPIGSSAIIKRVPAGFASPLAIHRNDAIENFGIKDIIPGAISSPHDKDRTLKKPSLSVKEDIIDFDDFGDDVCPVLERLVDDSSFNVKKNCSISSESPKINAIRCNKLTTELGRRLDQSDRSESVSRGPLAMGIGRDKLLIEGNIKTEEPSKLQKPMNASLIATQNADLPSELKCSLCKAPYYEAVMIPCCQNSYCERCIRPVLNEKSCCPDCSAKCRAEDLLPNLSLRHAVEIFLRSQVFAYDVEDVHHHAPDGESGIQGKEASGDLTIVKGDSKCCQPSKVIGKGPGHVISESALDWKSRNKTVAPGSSSDIDATERARQMYEEEVDSSCPVDLKCGNLVAFPDSEVKRQSMPEQVDSFVKTRNGLINSTGGGVNLLETGRDRKGCRACYMCGSLHHLIRNCPHASTPRPMPPQRGNAFFPDSISPFGNATPHVGPFADQFVNFGMMPLNTAVVPAAPLSVPMYMSTIYGGLPAYGGYMSLGSMAPVVGVGTGPDQSFQELNDLHNCEKQWELTKKYMTRDTSTDFGVDDGFMRRCHLVDVERCQKDGFSYSDESFSQKPQREHRHGHNLDSDIRWTDGRHQKTSPSSTSARDRRLYHREGISSPEAKDIPSCSSRRAKERHYYQNKDSKMLEENTVRFSSDSSWSPCQAEKRMDVKRKRDESNVKRRDRKPCSPELDCAHKFPSDKENRMRDNKSGHRPRESRHLRCFRHDGRSMNDGFIQDRWKMVSGSDEDGGRSQHHKRNKVR